MIKYKFITIEEAEGAREFDGKPVYLIIGNRKGEKLGVLTYHKAWKQYVFSSFDDCIFNNSCLKDIVDFIENHV